MADRDPAWLPMVVGGIIVTGWSAIVTIIAVAAILLADADIEKTVLAAFAAVVIVFVTCAKLVLADIRGSNDGR